MKLVQNSSSSSAYSSPLLDVSLSFRKKQAYYTTQARQLGKEFVLKFSFFAVIFRHYREKGFEFLSLIYTHSVIKSDVKIK